MQHVIITVLLLWSSTQGEIIVKNIPKKTATVGGNVTLLCQLMTSEPNVIQITWQKESGNFTGPVATTSKVYGKKVLGHYTRRAKHSTNVSPNISAISISNVTPEDEGCFKCIFNLFPSGACTGTICLEVNEATMSEPNLEVHEIPQSGNLDRLYLVTCSATGKPSPNITWSLPENVDIAPDTYTIINLNNEETVISNFTMSIPSTKNNGVPVICVVQHPSLSSKKSLYTKIYPAGNAGYDVKVITILMTASITLGFILLLHRRSQDKQRNRSQKSLLVSTSSS